MFNIYLHNKQPLLLGAERGCFHVVINEEVEYWILPRRPDTIKYVKQEITCLPFSYPCYWYNAIIIFTRNS